MEIQHPLAGEGDGVPPAVVDVNGVHVPVEDGAFAVDDEAWLQRFADRYDTTPEALVRETDDGGEDGDDPEPGDTICTCDVGDACDECGGDCPTAKSDGEVCGRNRPCSYHDDEDDED